MHLPAAGGRAGEGGRLCVPAAPLRHGPPTARNEPLAKEDCVGRLRGEVGTGTNNKRHNWQHSPAQFAWAFGQSTSADEADPRERARTTHRTAAETTPSYSPPDSTLRIALFAASAPQPRSPPLKPLPPSQPSLAHVAGDVAQRHARGRAGQPAGRRRRRRCSPHTASSSGSGAVFRAATRLWRKRPGRAAAGPSGRRQHADCVLCLPRQW